MILVENPGSNTFEFQDLSKSINLAKRKKYLLFLNTRGRIYPKPLNLDLICLFHLQLNTFQVIQMPWVDH